MLGGANSRIVSIYGALAVLEDFREVLGSAEFENGGGGEIRTLGGLSPSLVFKTSAFNRSATPPR